MTPAATADPITPAIFGPIACINKWFWELYSNPTLLTTLAAIGTAETPAAPISGLILVLLKIFIIFATITPVAVPIAKAIMPKIRMPNVSGVKNLSAASFDPTDKPKKIVTIFIKEFCATSLNLSTTKDYFIRLPKQSIPNRGAALGSNKPTNKNSIIGKIIFSFWDTLLNWTIWIVLSESEVKAFIIGGCINGTSAMYEYAATAIGPSSSGANIDDT